MAFWNPSDLEHAFVLSRQIMRILGIWPEPYVSPTDRHRPSYRFIIVAFIISYFTAIPQIPNIIRAWGNMTVMVRHIASANFCLIGLCKLIATRYHNEALRTLMTSVVTDWITAKTGERDTMLKLVKHGRNLSLKCCLSAMVGFLLYVYFHSATKIYRAWTHQAQPKLVYAFAYPYDTQKSPSYEITFFAQLFGGCLSTSIYYSVNNFISMLILHLCSQLINLRARLQDLVDELASKSVSSARYRKDLGAIVLRHENIIRNAKTINDSYSVTLFLFMFYAIFQMCFNTFQFYTMMTDKGAISIIGLTFLLSYVMIVVSHLYFYCYSAEKLITESTNVMYGVYECKWYDISPKDAKILMFIPYRSAIPLRLNAGKFAVFSMEMFVTTIKTSMGYVSALLAIRS